MNVTKKKRRVPLPVRIILIVLAAVIVIFGVIGGMQIYELSKMASLSTGEVIPGIYAVDNSMVNIYLVKGGAGYLMIDGGADKKQTESALAELGISPDEISAVLLTHSDSDHTGALPLFPNAEIYLSEQEVQMIDGTLARTMIFKNTLAGDYNTLRDGEIIELSGLSAECILTPGHTPGSMCYLIDGKYLFTGDSLSLKNGKAGLFNSFFNMDDEIQRASLYELAKAVNPEYIFTAHYGYTDNPAAAFQDWKN